MTIDLSLVDVEEVEGIDHRDYPDYCDAYISQASYNGKVMSEDMLEFINTECTDFVYEQVWDYIH